MNTASNSDLDCATDRPADLRQDGVDTGAFGFPAAPLPIIGRCAAGVAAAGVALAFATLDTDACGEDRFSLLVVDAEGEVLSRLGPFTEEDVVAVWRDLAAKSGLPRMLLREGGGLSTVSRQLGRLALGKTRQRRRHGLLNGRRPRFLVRRKATRLPARPQIHRGENEIIARN